VKKISLQWRITLMTVLLIGVTCVAMNLLLCSSGVYYMDKIADALQGSGTVILNESEAASFDPQLIAPNEELTIVVNGAQGRFRTTNWYITAAVTILSGILAYFVSGRALKPLRSFASQVEKVQLNNLADMRIDEDVLPEFRQLSRSFNQMLERLNNAFAAQRQFTGNAAHELRTPLALMQAQLELFSAEHPDVRPETAEFLTLLREQTERLIQMTRTLLEMSNLRHVARNERIQLAPMIEEIFTDLAPLSDKRGVTLTAEGDGIMTGSDALIYRLIFNLAENAVKYNRPGGSVRVSVTQEPEKLLLRVSDTGCGIPEEYQRSIFQPFFRVDKSRSREYGGAGLGLSLVWEIAELHGGSVWVEESSEKGTTIAVGLPAGTESDSLSVDIP
jgi:two-component system heavy metal sensor histidine kinase CusS